MMVNRSFTEYMKKRFDNNFWAVAEEFLTDNTDYVEGLSYKLHKVCLLYTSPSPRDCS